jgi:hypothetical protein
VARHADLWIGGEGSVMAETVPSVTTSEESVPVAEAGQPTSAVVIDPAEMEVSPSADELDTAAR